MQSLSEARVAAIINVISGAKRRPGEADQVAQSTEITTEHHTNTRKKMKHNSD